MRLPLSISAPPVRVVYSAKVPCVPKQVRRTHGGKHAAIELLRRKGDGHAQDGGGDLPLPEDLPEGLALAPHFHDRAAQRNAILAQLQNLRRLADARGRQVRHVRTQAAIQEIEHGVAGRVDPGGEGRPRHRRERRERGAQAVKASLLAQAAEVRQLAFLHVPLRQPRVETVESQEDQPLDFGVLVSLPAGNRAPQHANGPEQKADQTQKHSAENADERTEKREAGARTDISQFGLERKAHRTLPSTKGTSKTFLCMIGPCPKKPDSPNNSP